MPKLKTKKGAAKRIRLTKSGKIKVKKANLRHILTSKSPKRKRQLRKHAYVAGADQEKIYKILPYA